MIRILLLLTFPWRVKTNRVLLCCWILFSMFSISFHRLEMWFNWIHLRLKLIECVRWDVDNFIKLNTRESHVEIEHCHERRMGCFIDCDTWSIYCVAVWTVNIVIQKSIFAIVVNALNIHLVLFIHFVRNTIKCSIFNSGKWINNDRRIHSDCRKRNNDNNNNKKKICRNMGRNAKSRANDPKLFLVFHFCSMFLSFDLYLWIFHLSYTFSVNWARAPFRLECAFFYYAETIAADFHARNVEYTRKERKYL